MPLPPHRTFGSRLKAHRIMCQLTQDELAQKTKIPIGTIRIYERGRSLPPADRLHALISALGITTAELFEKASTPHDALT